MSLCVYLQTEDQIFIAADTAITRNVNGERYRQKEEMEKLFRIDDFLIFICGDLQSGIDIINDFKAEKLKSVWTLQKIIKRRYKKLVTEQPERLQELTKENDSLLSVICFEVNKEGVPVSYNFHPSNRFSAQIRKGVKGQTHIVAGGYSSLRAHQMAMSLYALGVPRSNLMQQVFNSLSGEGIGGHMTLYTMDRTGINQIVKEKIDETLKLRVVDDFQSAGNLVGGTIVGSLIKTAGEYPRIELSASDNLLRAYFSPRDYIEIQADYGGSPSINFIQNGQIKGRINTLMGFVEMYGNNGLVFNAGSATIDMDSKVVVRSFDHIHGRAEGTSVGDTLENISDRIGRVESDVSRKAERGSSTGSAGPFNAGIPIGTKLAVQGGGYVTWGGIPEHSHTQR